MGQAVLAGLLRPDVAVEGGIRATTRSLSRAGTVAEHPNLRVDATETSPGANLVAVTDARLVIIGVKPSMVTELLREIAPALSADAVVVSLAAGVTIDAYERALPASVAVVRAMPNTPSSIGKGVTGLSKGERASDEQFALVTALFELVGEVVAVPEADIDAVSSISGSGPAYFFYLVEQLTAAAIDKGFTPAQAATLVNGTFIGAAALLEHTGEDPAELRRLVTSPKGTTEQAIRVLSEGGLEQLFIEATDAAVARSRELASGS
ncbi:pyrroline-5-carboxylate reductase [Subtercola boreus]|uniref:Pyrroline-5-carboxylate reductase n=2 Tax=Subtercola boreus TaxID=120213 RepID=A0A3E0WBJ0_9MICO|nr:pyrroline-5-carboxylate reductase [Subtercola boreus]RFA19950.1 pyrroline-5-carboxylate reductase [Subtercola boreus]RFA26343.1 pyrroline-5-carboxylate reductase [Subtercola boreus]